MRVRLFYERERLKWSRVALALWVVAAYVATVYMAIRLGSGMPADNLLPSAD